LADGDTVALSLNTTRQKVKNLRANPAANVFLLDLAVPYRYLELRGDAEITPDDDYSFADQLGAKYQADLRTRDHPGESRVKVTIHPTRINAADMRLTPDHHLPRSPARSSRSFNPGEPSCDIRLKVGHRLESGHPAGLVTADHGHHDLAGPEAERLVVPVTQQRDGLLLARYRDGELTVPERAVVPGGRSGSGEAGTWAVFSGAGGRFGPHSTRICGRGAVGRCSPLWGHRAGPRPDDRSGVSRELPLAVTTRATHRRALPSPSIRYARLARGRQFRI